MTAEQRMSAKEALARLANACGDYATEGGACWELEALKREGWTVSMILGDNGFTLVLTPPIGDPAKS